MIYELNTLYFTVRFLPEIYRTVTIISWVKALLFPLQTLNNEFVNMFVVDTRKDLKKNAQTIVFEEFLTNKLGSNVTITTLNVDPTNFFVGLTGPDPAQVSLSGSQTINFVGESNNLNLVNFQVILSNAVWLGKTQAEKDEFIALIEEIKYLGTEYQIVLI